MSPLSFVKTAGVLALALSVTQSLSAQEEAAPSVETAPAVETAPVVETTPATGTSPESEVGPQTEPSVGPIVQTSPDEGTPFAGSGEPTGNFSVPRRLKVSVAVQGGYDDNVRTRSSLGSSAIGSPSGGGSSFFTNANLLLSYTFGTARTAFALSAGTGATFYFENGSYDPNLHLRVSLEEKVTERLTLHLSTLLSYQAQPDISTDLGSSRRRGNFFRSRETLSASYKLTPRLSTTPEYTFSSLNFGGSSGSSSDRVQHTFSESLRFLVLPTTSLHGEYKFSVNDYADGARDSTIQSLIGGLEQTLTSKLKASLKGGVQFRSPDAGAGRTSPYGETTLSYEFAPKASVHWVNRYSLEESDDPGASSRSTFRTGLDASYQFTGRIFGSLALNYVLRDSGGGGGGSSGNRDTFDIAPSLRYALTHNLALTAGYHHTQLDSDVRGYSRNRYFGGVNYTF